MNNFSGLQLFLQDSWYAVLFAFLALFILYYIIRNRNDYSYFINLFNNDFVKGIELLDKTEDLELKKELILTGKKDLDDKRYDELKDYLTNSGFLVECFKDLSLGDVEQKIASCRVLSEIATPQAIDYCIVALYDEKIPVRKAAIEQLAKTANLKIINSFISYLDYSDEQSLLNDLGAAFEVIGKQAFKQLKNIVVNKKPALKIWAIKILNNLELRDGQEEELFNLYLHLIDDASKDIKLEVIHGLSKFRQRDEEVVFAKLIAKLSDAEWKVRAEAIKVLGNTGIIDACSYIYKAVDDSHAMVRKNAFYSLVKLGYEGIKYLIRATYESEYSKEAFEILDDLDTKFLIEAVVRIYETGDGKEKKIAKDLLQTKLKEEPKDQQLKIIG